jgi:hypothetical protein
VVDKATADMNDDVETEARPLEAEQLRKAVHQELTCALQVLLQVETSLRNEDLKRQKTYASVGLNTEDCSVKEVDDASEKKCDCCARLRAELEEVTQLAAMQRDQLDATRSSEAALEDIAKQLQSDTLTMDVDRLRLSKALTAAKEENEVLAKVMERLSQDYDELKQDVDRNVKVTALRNTARALECENELINTERKNLEDDIVALRKAATDNERALQEKLSACEARVADVVGELQAKDAERTHFVERFERLQNEKLNVMNQLLAVEKELELCRVDLCGLEEERAEMQSERDSSSEVMAALREAKRSVEHKLQAVMADNAGLSEQAQVFEERAISLEETVRLLDDERRQAQFSSVALEERMTEQNSLYESRVSLMQEELGRRIEEINECKAIEVDQVKERYIGLFEEKAAELSSLRAIHSSTNEELRLAKARIVDLEEREAESQTLLGRSQAAQEERFRTCNDEITAELVLLREVTARSESELESARQRYEALQQSYRTSVETLQKRLLEITSLLHEHSKETKEIVNSSETNQNINNRDSITSHRSESLSGRRSTSRKKARKKKIAA